MTSKLLPLTLVGGYLGSGKTTLVNHLLRHAENQRIAVLVNEFGNLPIDADLIETKEDRLISIAGGCVCCSYGSDMMRALMELTKLSPQIDHILLEASGVALPKNIVQSVKLIPEYQFQKTVVLVNCNTILDCCVNPYMGDTIRSQLRSADLLILNKIDLVSEQVLSDVISFGKKVAPAAEIITSKDSIIPTTSVLTVDQLGNQGSRETYFDDEESEKHEDHNFHKSISIPVCNIIHPDKLANLITHAKPDIVRAKGFGRAADGNTYSIQVVGKEVDIFECPLSTDYSHKMTFIFLDSSALKWSEKDLRQYCGHLIKISGSEN